MIGTRGGSVLVLSIIIIWEGIFFWGGGGRGGERGGSFYSFGCWYILDPLPSGFTTLLDPLPLSFLFSLLSPLSSLFSLSLSLYFLFPLARFFLPLQRGCVRYVHVVLVLVLGYDMICSWPIAVLWIREYDIRYSFACISVSLYLYLYLYISVSLSTIYRLPVCQKPIPSEEKPVASDPP